MSDQPQTEQQRIALVTGASRGLGYAAARALARTGAHIVATGRTVGGLEELDDEIRADGGTTTLVPLDLTAGDEIEKLAGAVHDRWGRLDILISNAGELGELAPVPHIEPKTFATAFAVNAAAPYRLIRAFDPLLRAAPAARVVSVSTLLTVAPRAYWGVYAASKAAGDSLALTYALECADTAIRINLLDPGPARTGMRAKAMPGEDPDTLPHPDELAPMFVAMTAPDFNANGARFRFRDWRDTGVLQPVGA